MPVISVCSTKGGVGKTTLVICLADAFARQGGTVVVLDADPNGHVAAWREMAGEECQVDVVPGVNEATIQEQIEEASGRYGIVLVDLEGAASQSVTYAIAWSDLVLMPTKTSGMDLQELYRTYAVVQRTEKALRRPIAARAVFSQMPALINRVSKHARGLVEGRGIPVLGTEIIHRPAAYQAMHFTGATPVHPDGDPKAATEVRACLDEVLKVLEQGAVA
ncbi:ParA family protein [uncultured Methylobacterium sp.]|jgi:chromosome partitioning protein|uniref:ParA family protein n=1 Tax=uncultured Methylobacterium sp. TaxID=157278 RepID=UPI002629AF74|nr:ParA family protein [uncultured Methylobacterium sp.]